MTEKRFELAWEDFDGWAIYDTTDEYSDDEDYIDWLSGQKAVDVLNHFADENEQLKQQCKDFMEMLDDMCIAYLVNDGLEEILNDSKTIYNYTRF